MTTNRHLSDVIDELIAAEPKLTSILKSSLMRTRYCAPEVMIHVWNDVARLLSIHFPARVDLQAIYNGTADSAACDPKPTQVVDGCDYNSPTTER